MTTFRWLHLTDLHLGMPGQQSLWPNVEEMFLTDLDYLRKEVGPWDLVLFTGDITQRGTEPEFDEVDKLLQKLWSRFNDWGFSPKLLAIPGNHDLVRPRDVSDTALLTLLHNWHLPAVQTPFWEKGDSPQRCLISVAFQGFSKWWENTNPPFYVPYSPKGDHVIGREEALGKVRQQLTVGRRTAIGQAAVSRVWAVWARPSWRWNTPTATAMNIPTA